MIWRSTPAHGAFQLRSERGAPAAGHDQYRCRGAQRYQPRRALTAGTRIIVICGQQESPVCLPPAVLQRRKRVARGDAITPSRLAFEEVVVTGTRQPGLQVVASPALHPDAQRGKSAPGRRQSGSHGDLCAGRTVDDHAGVRRGIWRHKLLQAVLRGLSPNDVLVLVNGKRRHTTANLAVASGSPYQGGGGVDLNYIPIDAIDHIAKF